MDGRSRARTVAWLVLFSLALALLQVGRANATHVPSSSYYVSDAPLPGSPAHTYLDPKVQLTGTSSKQVEWHNTIDAGACSIPSNTYTAVVVLQAYDSEDVALPGGGVSADYHWGNTVCGNWRDFPNVSQSSGVNAGAASVVFELYICPFNDFSNLANCTLSATAATVGAPVPPGAPTNLRVTSVTDGGKVLTFDHVAALSLRAGFTRTQAVTMTAIAKAESSFRTAAVSYTGCCFGLWQIHGEVWNVTKREAFDPYRNSVLAKKVYDQPAPNGGYEPWEAYTLGMHTEWMDEAEAAVDRQIANGQADYSTIDAAPSAGDWSVSLAWDHDDVNVEDYELQKSVADPWTSWSSVCTPVAPACTDAEAGSAGEVVRYRVRARNDAGNSAWSEHVEVTLGTFDPDDDASVPGTGGSPGDDVDPGDDAGGDAENCIRPGRGTNCGLSFICYIKVALRWAFVPGQGTCEAWNEFLTNLQSKPPFSIAYAGLSIITELADAIQTRLNNPDTGLCSTVTLPALGEHEACFGASLQQLADGHPVMVGALRTGLLLVMIAQTAVLIWRILKAAFSKTTDPAGGEHVAAKADAGDERDDR